MKVLFSFIAIILTMPAIAQIRTPAPSPSAEVKQSVGVTDFAVSYSRPGVKDRMIFGDLVPFGTIWRTGANAATTIESSTDFMFGDQSIEAGKYAVYTLPDEEEWQVMLYSDLSMGGNVGAYDQEKEVARISVPVSTYPVKTERFTILFADVTDSDALLQLIWDKTMISIPLSVPTEKIVMAEIDRAMENPMARVANTYAQAATYYAAAGKDLEQAEMWMKKAIEIRPEAFWNIYTLATIQAKQGKYDTAVATAQEAIEEAKKNKMGGDFGYIKRSEEAIAEWSKM